MHQVTSSFVLLPPPLLKISVAKILPALHSRNGRELLEISILQ